jgi:hypothetical protein
VGEKSHPDRAFELIVYAPIGAAMYMRDMAPSMLGIFIARGKREVAAHRAPPEPAAAPLPTPTDVRQKMEEGFGAAAGAAGAAAGAAAGGVGLARDVAVGSVGLARDVAGTALAGFLQRRTPAPSGAAPGGPATTEAPPSADVSWPAPASAPTTPTPSESAVGSTNGAPADVPAVDDLPIPDYDELSASQVVERLDGLDHESLDRIRRYESAHRARNTILGKIAQLG